VSRGLAKQVELCLCEPQRVARIVRANDGGADALPSGVLRLLPVGMTVEYVARCPDYPGGCRWIELTAWPTGDEEAGER
jgi:hypothetical protein